ncbi:MAG: hypothetical protein HZC47_06690 [Methanobacterium sp.]|uniref:hypothetical protein n=1 Tax=Methanobacterium sp. TaxID=2164 RepID=UPI003D64C3F9|nr:hypothetical protein [Methanobacterium sp.]
MVNVKELLEPNGFKIILTILLFILFSVWAVAISSPDYLFYYKPGILNNLILVLNNIWWLLIIILVISYFIGAFMDHYIDDKNLKTLITIVLGFMSIISIYLMFRLLSEPVICDPVHRPNTTESYNLNLLNEIKVDKNAVKDSLAHCLENIYK